MFQLRPTLDTTSAVVSCVELIINGVTFEIAKLVVIHVPKSFLELEKMKDGKWRLIVSEDIEKALCPKK